MVQQAIKFDCLVLAIFQSFCVLYFWWNQFLVHSISVLNIPNVIKRDVFFFVRLVS